MEVVILNSGPGAWAFESLALQLSALFQIPVSQNPARKNYVLSLEGELPDGCQSFISLESVRIATDKRETARVFERLGVPAPRTFLLEENELNAFFEREGGSRWLLKWPTGCGGAGHRFLNVGDTIPTDWPRPLVVQEFIALRRPEVFRVYCAGGEMFGFNARRFNSNQTASPFVAHARGAHYEIETAPKVALEVARLALESTGLLQSFGAVDLLLNPAGEWLALEVNTDGIWMHVDRDVPSALNEEIKAQLKCAFAAWVRFS